MNKVKLFSHRGYAINDINQNTLASLKNAVKFNFEAIEFDIWYTPSVIQEDELLKNKSFHDKNLVNDNEIIPNQEKKFENKFDQISNYAKYADEELLIKHDRPSKSEIKKLPTFNEFLLYENNLEYWLDFKNLNEENCEIVAKKVKNLLEKKAINLNKVFFAPYITDYKIAQKIFDVFWKVFQGECQMVAVCDNESQFSSVKNFLLKNHVKFLSIDNKLINQNLKNEFNNISFFAWTVNDISRMKYLSEIGVKYFATDKIIPETFQIFS